MAGDVWDGVRVVSGGPQYSRTSSGAWRTGVQCSNCDSRQHAVVAELDLALEPVQWLLCVTCGAAHVASNAGIYPSPRVLSEPSNLPPDEAAVWSDVRGCLGIRAWGAAVLLCRKILLHTAVTAGLPAKNDKDRAPTFIQAVEYLEHEGFITARMRPWVDRIKDVGNEATHEIPAISEEQAMDVAKFTEQLLRLVYELTAMANPTPPAAAD